MGDDSGELDLRDYLDSVEEFCTAIESRTVSVDDSSTPTQIGTYFETELRDWFEEKHGLVSEGSVAEDIDLPAFNLDVKRPRTASPSRLTPLRTRGSGSLVSTTTSRCSSTTRSPSAAGTGSISRPVRTSRRNAPATIASPKTP